MKDSGMVGQHMQIGWPDIFRDFIIISLCKRNFFSNRFPGAKTR